jgi:hypothetical protein
MCGRVPVPGRLGVLDREEVGLWIRVREMLDCKREL